MENAVHSREFAGTRETAGTRKAVALTAGGSMLKAIGGIAVAILAILALIGVVPALLIAIAGIVFGAAMLLEGIGISGEYSELASRVADTRAESVEFGGSVGVEMLVGLAAIALGILSLLGVDAPTLIPVLIITGGTGLILSAGTTERLNDLRLMSVGQSDMSRRVTRDAMMSGAIAQVLGGLAAVVLGILALVAVGNMAAEGFGTMPQVGMLVLGVATFFSGGAIAGKVGRMYHHG